ncbi:MAG: excinuclease ABC subunit UvrC [Candidatus Kapaibacteriales bacterium]
MDEKVEKLSLEKFNNELKNKISNLPNKPGVYIYKNKLGKIIYIGKAINLRNRVRSYFQSNRIVDAKTNALIRNIADLEYIVTDNEAEALILEDSLIKKYKPKYNILLRDDKTYPYIRITNEEFPQIFSTRRIVRDGSRYFGPYTDVQSMKKVLRLARSIFKIRSCKLNLTEESVKFGKFRLCLDYQIGKCDGPCEGLISKTDYNDNVKNAIRLIEGKTNEIEKMLESKMIDSANKFEYERAAYFRNQIFLLRDFTYNQKIVTTELIDRDVIGFARNLEYTCTLIFKIRDGRLIGKHHYIFKDSKNIEDTNILRVTLEKWYLESEFVPDEILLPMPIEEEKFLLDYLRQKKGKAVLIVVPKLGEKRKIVDLANENADFQLKEYLLAIQKRDAILPKIVLQLQKDLNLSQPPRYVVCFDNSHLQGQELVSSMVAFKDDKPLKSEYRRFKIKTVSVGDDFGAMREAVQRFFRRVIDEHSELPNLMIIDGGKGQLNEVLDVVQEYGLKDKIAIISIAKKLEEIYLPNLKEPVVLPRFSPTLQFIQRVRDEAHRFAIKYHRALREKRTITTELLQIEGIGKKTANKLLSAFGSVSAIKTLGYEEISKVVGKKLAEKIFKHFNGLEVKNFDEIK